LPSRERIRELLEDLKAAHAAHALAYQKTRSRLGTDRKGQKARHTRKELLDSFYEKLRFFNETVLAPLTAAFLAGDRAAINEVLNFLEVDVAAFRTGYSKEWYYGKLKGLKLEPSQVERLKEIAVRRCLSPEYRREDSELRRLMIRLADMNFVRRAAELPDSPNPYVRRKKWLMLEVVLRGRKDLRKEVEASIAPPSR
jgi:hypothetical protein